MWELSDLIFEWEITTVIWVEEIEKDSTITMTISEDSSITINVEEDSLLDI